MVDDKYKQEDFIDFILVCSIQHGLGVDITMLPTAVEKQGVYTWDEYGRFYYAGAGTAGAEKALRVLKDYCATIKASLYDGEKQAVLDDYWWDGDESPLNDYGWPKDKLPDFKGLHDEWNLKNLGTGVKSIDQPRPQSVKGKNYMLRLIRALSEALVGGLTGKPKKDAGIILEKLAADGVAAPLGLKALESYLKEANAIEKS